MLPKYNHDPDDLRMRAGMARAPSPTPSELRELEMGVIDWKALRKSAVLVSEEMALYVLASFNCLVGMLVTPMPLFSGYYAATVVILVVVALVSIYHTPTIHWLTPATRVSHMFRLSFSDTECTFSSLKFGWLVF